MKTALALAKTRPAKIIPAVVRFFGGWDAETPALSLPSGFVRSAQNWEADSNSGYASILGYERFDGRPAPSAAVASVLDITLTGAIAVGDTVTGATSGATGVVIVVPDSTHIVITKIAVSTFQNPETLNVGGLPQADTTSLVHGASTAILRAQYKNTAADEYRDDIAVPTGSGSSLCGVEYNDVLYTFRNNAGGTAVDVWKSTTAGWSQVTLFNEVSFTAGGLTEPAEASTLTQGANTATIKRVVLTSGSWTAGTAAGRLIVTTPAPGNFIAAAATVGTIDLTLSGAQTAITLLPDGRFEFIITNFGGSVATTRIYGCDGVNRGFEFDGTVLVPIATGMATDAPNHVYEHKKQLFFSFGASVQHSAPATPYIWSVILGASEIGMGDTVTGLYSQPGSESVGALAIFCRNLTSILYGTGVSNWQLVPYRKEVGAYAWSVQDVGYTMMLDDLGITSLKTAQEFGNFAHAALSTRIKTWLTGKRGKTTASCVARNKSQYRLFFSDAYALFVTFSGKYPQFMPVKLNHAATWAWSSEQSDGTEVIYFGAGNGMVYQMEKGTSFDGDSIDHWIDLAWDFLKSPRLIKKFIDAALEISGTGYAEFTFGYSLGYGSSEISQPETQTEITSFSTGIWDDAALTWDQVGLVWDGQTLTPSVVDMPGEAENVSITVRGTSDYHEAIHVNGAIINYIPRRHVRG